MGPKSVFITGTKSGIGFEFVRQFATSDDPPQHIFASCRIPNVANNLRALANKHNNIHLVDLDVTDDEQIQAAVEFVSSKVGEDGLNLLINNAGINLSEAGTFPHVNRDAIMRLLDVNTVSPLILTQAFFPLLKKAADKTPEAPLSISRAAVVNITSEAGKLHNFSSNLLGSYGYRTSKAGLSSLTKSLSFDLKEHGILIVGCCPGYVNTGLTKNHATLLKDNPILEKLNALKQEPEEAVGLCMETMKKFMDAHTGGCFRRNGEKSEDYQIASAAGEK